MALRQIREFGEPVLEKKAKKVKEVTPRIRELVEDMFETMYHDYGVGLAAPQVGMLKRIFVIDIDGENPYVFINPEILETSGEQTGDEGCLSLPGKTGTVTRPQMVKVRAWDLDMNEFVLEAEDLLARAVCHENDHLDGVLYTAHVEGEIRDVGELPENEEDAGFCGRQSGGSD